MNISVNVCAPPLSSQAADSAYRFCQAAIQAGHQIDRVFFYADGVLNSNQLLSPPCDERNLYPLWCELAKQHKITLAVCIAASVRRGILDEQEAIRYDKTNHTLQAPFKLTGLAELIEGMNNSDRTITFSN